MQWRPLAAYLFSLKSDSHLNSRRGTVVLGFQTNGDAISVLVLAVVTVATCANHITPDNTRYQLITILRPTLQVRIGRRILVLNSKVIRGNMWPTSTAGFRSPSSVLWMNTAWHRVCSPVGVDHISRSPGPLVILCCYTAETATHRVRGFALDHGQSIVYLRRRVAPSPADRRYNSANN